MPITKNPLEVLQDSIKEAAAQFYKDTGLSIQLIEVPEFNGLMGTDLSVSEIKVFTQPNKHWRLKWMIDSYS